MNIFIDLINLMEEINNVYLTLYKLECLGDRENSYFFNKVNELKKMLVIEEDLFNKLVSTSEYSSIKDAVMESKGPVFSRIKDYISRYEHYNEEIYVDEEKKFKSNIKKLYDACSRNIFLVYLSYLQEYIDTTNNVLMREKLLSLKYYDAFVRLEIGKILINNDFNISKSNYVDLYLVADMLRMKEDISYEMIADAHATALKEMIRELFSITDDKYNDYDVVVASKNIEFMIRACLSLINDDYFDYMQDEMLLLIDELSNDNNTKAFDIIDMVLESRNKDKSRIMKLSLRPIDG